eukprot:PhM_4_TR12615/c0_g1_i1/m.86524
MQQTVVLCHSALHRLRGVLGGKTRRALDVSEDQDKGRVRGGPRAVVPVDAAVPAPLHVKHRSLPEDVSPCVWTLRSGARERLGDGRHKGVDERAVVVLPNAGTGVGATDAFEESRARAGDRRRQRPERVVDGRDELVVVEAVHLIRRKLSAFELFRERGDEAIDGFDLVPLQHKCRRLAVEALLGHDLPRRARGALLHHRGHHPKGGFVRMKEVRRGGGREHRRKGLDERSADGIVVLVFDAVERMPHAQREQLRNNHFRFGKQTQPFVDHLQETRRLALGVTEHRDVLFQVRVELHKLL